MKILGISSFYHDSAAAIIEDGKIMAAAQEERFTRKKHDAGFPSHAVRYCLEYTGTSLDALDAVVFYDKPLLKFERLLETYYTFAPRGIRSFMAAIPVWSKEKMFLKRILREELGKIGSYNKKKLQLLFPEHHLSHAASAFYPSGFEEAAILTIDGVGEWATASISHGKGKEITILRELRFPHSLGLLYSAFTYFLGFKVNSGEYKLMGLAPYGRSGSAEVEHYKDIIRNYLVDIREDGSLWLNQKYFDYATGLRMVKDKAWEALFNIKKREPESSLLQEHCDLGLAIQHISEEVVIKMARQAKELTSADYLCMAGGVALNCVANGKLLKEGIFKEIFIQPAAGDAGGSLGAALAAYHIYFDQPRILTAQQPDAMHGAYLGPDFSDKEIELVARKYQAPTRTYKDNELYQCVAGHIAAGAAVGWFQGRMEFGPRALGARSILGDPRNGEMQKKLNLKIKYRESFRPFAPSVLDEDVKEFFDLSATSPYMLIVDTLTDGKRRKVPDSYEELPLKDKLYYQRSEVPGITHVDFSARIQTVHKETNLRYWCLIEAFKKQTGCGMVVNTSFNVRGEPIVCTPEDAYRCFMRTEMDFLVMNNYLFAKEDQPKWKEEKEWTEEYTLD